MGAYAHCTAAGKIIKIISSLVPAQDEKGTESFTTSETVFIDRGQVFNFQHSVQLPAPGEYRCSLVLADAQDNMLGLVQTPMLVHYEELSLKVLEPGYRSAIYSTQKCPELILALKSDVLTDVADSVQAEFCIFGDGEQAPLLKKTASFNEFMRQPFTVAIPALPPGTYHCRITAQVSENHTASAQTAFTVHAPAPFETWVNEHGRIVRNGQPVFPIGSYADYWRYLPDSDRWILSSVTLRRDWAMTPPAGWNSMKAGGSTLVS